MHIVQRMQTVSTIIHSVTPESHYLDSNVGGEVSPSGFVFDGKTSVAFMGTAKSREWQPVCSSNVFSEVCCQQRVSVVLSYMRPRKNNAPAIIAGMHILDITSACSNCVCVISVCQAPCTGHCLPNPYYLKR